MSRVTPRLALLLSSYARVIDLLRQVFSMVYAQTYKETHLFISVKGVAESVVKETVLPQIEHLIDRGKVSLRVDGNTNQVWNLLDTVRGEELEGYDLLLKIDDDDYYHPEYLAYCAQAVRLGAKNTSTYVSGKMNLCEKKAGTYQLLRPREGEFGIAGWGNMLGLSRPILDHLFHVYEDREALLYDLQRFGYTEDADLGGKEDRYFYRLLREDGPSVDLMPGMRNAGISPVIVGAHTREESATRGLEKYHPTFFNSVRSIRRGEEDKEKEYIIEGEEGEYYALFRHKLTYLHGEGYASYAEFKDGELIFFDGTKWVRQENGRYVKM